MKGSVNIWAWCALCLFKCVNNEHLKNAKYLDYLGGLGTDVKNDLGYEVTERKELNTHIKNTNHNRTESLKNITDNFTKSNKPNSIFKEFESDKSENVTDLVLRQNHRVSSPLTKIKKSPSYWTDSIVSPVMSHLQNLMTFLPKKNQSVKTNFMSDIQENLLKIYEDQFEDRNDFINIVKNDLHVGK